MTDRPITLSAPEVRAVLDGRKTQFRKVLKPTPKQTRDWRPDFSICPAARLSAGFVAFDHPKGGPYTAIAQPYFVGDRLWVRETWTQDGCVEGIVAYRAYSHDLPSWVECGKWRSPFTMPRWASRISLMVTDVRVERLQDISCADCFAEGIPRQANSISIDCDTPDPRHDFRDRWVHRHGPASWDANPWVVAITFERIDGGNA